MICYKNISGSYFGITDAKYGKYKIWVACSDIGDMHKALFIIMINM